MVFPWDSKTCSRKLFFFPSSTLLERELRTGEAILRSAVLFILSPAEGGEENLYCYSRQPQGHPAALGLPKQSPICPPLLILCSFEQLLTASLAFVNGTIFKGWSSGLFEQSLLTNTNTSNLWTAKATVVFRVARRQDYQVVRPGHSSAFPRRCMRALQSTSKHTMQNDKTCPARSQEHASRRSNEHFGNSVAPRCGCDRN